MANGKVSLYFSVKEGEGEGVGAVFSANHAQIPKVGKNRPNRLRFDLPISSGLAASLSLFSAYILRCKMRGRGKWVNLSLSACPFSLFLLYVL